MDGAGPSDFVAVNDRKLGLQKHSAICDRNVQRYHLILKYDMSREPDDGQLCASMLALAALMPILTQRSAVSV